MVHGTNFVVPPTKRAGAVVSVHDLTPLHHPELCNRATLAYPGLIRKALRRGAWVHTDSAFVADEVMEAFGADPARVRVVAPGVSPPIELDPATARAHAASYLPAGVQSLRARRLAPLSRARIFPAWCAPSISWPIVTPN